MRCLNMSAMNVFVAVSNSGLVGGVFQTQADADAYVADKSHHMGVQPVTVAPTELIDCEDLID